VDVGYPVRGAAAFVASIAEPAVEAGAEAGVVLDAVVLEALVDDGPDNAPWERWTNRLSITGEDARFIAIRAATARFAARTSRESSGAGTVDDNSAGIRRGPPVAPSVTVV